MFACVLLEQRTVMFCGPETVDVSRGEAEENIDSRGDQTTELYYIWRKHANLSSVKRLKPKTWRIFDEFDVILHHIHGNG